MDQMDTVYPQYAFAIHKGYATRKHRTLLAEHGPCPLHRRSFAPVVKLLIGAAGADEWDAEVEWIPDVEDDPELDLYRESPAP
jgi:hypothetical protein